MRDAVTECESACPSVEAPPEFRRRVLTPLDRLRRRVRAYLLIEGAAVVIGLALLVAGVQFAVDRLLHLPADTRAVLLLAGTAILATAVWRRLVAPLRVALPPAELAMLVERRRPGLRSGLVSAVEFALGTSAKTLGAARPSPALVRGLFDQVIAEAAEVPWGRLLNHRRAAGWCAALLACVAAAGLTARLAGPTVGLWFRRAVLLRDDAWPRRTRLVVEGLKNGKLRCARGDDLTVSASVLPGYEVPRQVFIEREVAGGGQSRDQMLRIGRDRFQRTFERVGAPMRCRVRGGDDRTDWFEVEVVDRPAVTGVVIGVEPPKYTGAAPYQFRPGLTAVEVLRGSLVRFQITTNKPVVRAALVRGTATLDGRATRRSDMEWVAEDRPEHSTAYSFELTDALGLTNHDEGPAPMQVSVRLAADAPPKVRLQVRGVSDMATPEAILPLQVELSDTYGLASAELIQESTRATKAARVVPIEGFEPKSPTFVRSFHWPLAPLALVPGDRLSLYAQASDFDDVHGPNVGKSAVVSLRIVSREELLNELARREQQYRQEFEQLVRGQEDLYAGVLSVLTAIGSGAATEAHRQEFGRLERRQRQQAARTDALRRRFEQVLAEMEVNQALTPSARERLGARVVEPMGELVRNAMAEALTPLGRLTRQDSAEDRAQLRPRQQRVLADMRAVLAAMLKYEGFQEAISLLRDILSLQGAVHEETEKRIADEVERIFGPGK